MITITKAKIIAQNRLDEISKAYLQHYSGDSLIFLDDKTLTFDQGWMFFWTSKKYHDTKDVDFILLGNGLIFVSKSGNIIELPTSNHPSVYIEELKNKGTLLGKKL